MRKRKNQLNDVLKVTSDIELERLTKLAEKQDSIVEDCIGTRITKDNSAGTDNQQTELDDTLNSIRKTLIEQIADHNSTTKQPKAKNITNFSLMLWNFLYDRALKYVFSCACLIISLLIIWRIIQPSIADASTHWSFLNRSTTEFTEYFLHDNLKDNLPDLLSQPTDLPDDDSEIIGDTLIDRFYNAELTDNTNLALSYIPDGMELFSESTYYIKHILIYRDNDNRLLTFTETYNPTNQYTVEELPATNITANGWNINVEKGSSGYTFIWNIQSKILLLEGINLSYDEMLAIVKGIK